MEFNASYKVSKEMLKSGLTIFSFLPFKWAKQEVENTIEALRFLEESGQEALTYDIHFSCKSMFPLMRLAPVVTDIMAVLQNHRQLIHSVFKEFLRGVKWSYTTNDLTEKHRERSFDGSKDPKYQD